MAVGSPQYDNTLSGASDTWDNDNASPILYADYFETPVPPSESWGKLKVSGTFVDISDRKLKVGGSFVDAVGYKVKVGGSFVDLA
jgi:hypothetical protein